MISLYMKFPVTMMMNPNNCKISNFYFQTIISKIQIRRVLATSMIDLVNELIFYVTVTPKTLKDPILTIVLITATISKPL